jgi:protein-tyrosine phosphatase
MEAEVEALQTKESQEKHEGGSSDSRRPSEILAGFLWLSDATSAINPVSNQRLGITHVVNATNRCVPNRFEEEGVAYHNADLDDDESNAIQPFFEPMFQFVKEAEESGGHVLIHCMCGISRSSTLVISYLMKSRQISLRQAFEQVKRARPIAAPNPRFAKDLCCFELELASQRTRVSGIGIPHNTISATDMVSKNYRKANENAAKARTALDSLGGGGGETKCLLL